MFVLMFLETIRKEKKKTKIGYYLEISQEVYKKAKEKAKEVLAKHPNATTNLIEFEVKKIIPSELEGGYVSGEKHRSNLCDKKIAEAIVALFLQEEGIEAYTVYKNVEGSGGGRYDKGLLPTSSNTTAVKVNKYGDGKEFPLSCKSLPPGAFALVKV